MPKIVVKAGSRPPWVGLAAAAWVQVCAGNAYNFPLYSTALKSVLGYNQQQLTILGVANDIGENVGLIPGIVINKFPPWAVLFVGVVSCLFGYGVLWLAVSGTVSGLPYWLLFVALVVATNSNAWFGTAVLVTNMRNFPLSRGTVSGILKGYVGLSASVYTLLFNVALDKSATKLLLFLTVGIPIICLAMMYFIRPCTPASGEEDSSEHVHFVFTQAANVVLAIYLVTATIVSDVISLSSAVSYVLIAVMVIFLISPLAIPIKMTLFPAPKKALPATDSSDHLVPSEGESALTDTLLTPSSSATHLGSFLDNDYSSDMETLLAVGEGAVKKKRKPKRGEDFTFREAMIKADFWLLWVVYFLGVGAGVTILNNLAQIGVAFGLDDTTKVLALFSFCNFVGRLGSGAVSEHFVRSRALPRTVWMTCALVIMTMTLILFAFDLNGILYVAAALIGVAYGILYSVMVPTASELFGLKHFGIIYTTMLLGNPAGALLFSGLLAGHVYDAEAAKQGSSTCIGVDCFKLTFLALASLCGLGTILSVILTVRIRPVYQMLYAGGSFRLPHSSGH
ncbi:protein NUCLEAR FUSION DEFECTIVE 4 [Mercurialis annua]|uniref:protein NUCLEAR FUSION DEFECTIVE 4 n=1 Tax=Mercurialis annua TaxID=3986 RepID=UPI0021602A75|nr:protein NUCLEAR FUSION DEFECTIVE 4 [Mercurialis annua]